jgi:drug/metabolite transporter (DMT)-like permease
VRKLAILLGLAAAATYGAADFMGGLVSRKANPICVVLLSQLGGLVLLALMLPFGGADPTMHAFLWGAAAGVGGGGGVVFLYRGLARGRMSVIAPITAVEAAIIPVAYGLFTGEEPGFVALAGVVIALFAVALVSSSNEGGPEGAAPRARLAQPGMTDALIAGFGFGCFFIFLSHAGSGTGLWPLVGTKASSISLVLIAAAATRAGFRPPRGTLPLILAAGLLDVSANILYLVASRLGLLSLVAVLTSLYPASTVLLARVVLRERMSRVQIVGLVLVVTGVALIAGG